MTVLRGCGVRVQGGVYIECRLSPLGSPFEDFIVDPPVVAPFEVSKVGIMPITGPDGVTHLLDRVGSGYYPNVADFVEEARRFGISRRIAKSFDFSKLSEKSRLVLVHDRAMVRNYEDYDKHIVDECPKHIQHPTAESGVQSECCMLLWYNDIETGAQNGPGRAIRVNMPSFTYEANRRPDKVRPKYMQGIFASFPITNIAVIKGNDHRANAKAARRSGLPVTEEDS